ncbi:MAG: arsenic efflux protein [Oscillospiraceae bacterium]|nr:arsenic efflux protein [Oscillospiraceae bacterium]
MHHFFETVLHVLPDALRMLPFLFGAYLLMEYMEHKAPDKMKSLLVRRSGSGVVVGALLGCLPQCGFSVAAANLFAGGVVTMGTLIAVFLSTSDEALMVLLAHPDRWVEIFRLLACKVVLAVAVGLLVDYIGRKKHGHDHKEHIHDLCGECGCGQHHGGILRPALWHTLHVFVFIFAVMLLLDLGVHALGEDRLAAILLTDSIFQPLLTALVGFIPNCAVSVVLTELYISGSLSFGAAVAGLSTGAGVGLLVLWRTNRNPKANLQMMLILFAASALAGILLQLVM